VGKLSFYFFLSKIVPAASGLLQITFLLRGLGIEGYGTFALLLSIASIISVFFLQWIQKAMLRFVSEGRTHEAALATYQLILSLCIFVLASVGEFLSPGRYVFVCGVLALAISMKEFVLEKLRAQAKVKLYGYLYGASSLCLMGLAYLTTVLDISISCFVYIWALINFLFGFPFVLHLSRAGFRESSIDNFRELFCYGFPLALSGAIGQIYFSGVRIFIGYWYGAYEAGVYSAVYDLVQRSMVVYMQVINSASFPLIRRCWDSGRRDDVERLLRSNFFLLVYPTTFWLIFVYLSWPYLNDFLSLGELQGYAELVLMIGLGVLLNRLKTFHIDYVFHLSISPREVLFNALVSSFSLIILLFVFARQSDLQGVSIIVSFSYFLGLLLALKRAIKIFPSVINLVDLTIYFFIVISSYSVSMLWEGQVLLKVVSLVLVFIMSFSAMYRVRYKPLFSLLKG